jgi:hypothetical protein
MNATRRKTGLPAQLEREREILEGQSPEEFAEEFFGAADKPQDGLPTLDELKTRYKTKSAAIRYLVSIGTPVKVIAKHLGIKYQHARNVATTQLKRGPNEDWRPAPLNTQPEPEFET